MWVIGDVLNNEGYNQEFMIDSDGKFARRSSYFRDMVDILYLIIIQQLIRDIFQMIMLYGGGMRIKNYLNMKKKIYRI